MTVVRHPVDSLCANCLAVVPSNFISSKDELLLVKGPCPNGCSTSKQENEWLIASEGQYVQAIHDTLKKRSDTPIVNQGILEVTDECNFKCATCIANSFPGAGNTKSLTEIKRTIDNLCHNKYCPESLVISGGEPTIHPDICNILSYCDSKEFERVVLISNGTRIAEDADFCDFLASLKGKLEVYLQFDSLNDDVLEHIRGERLSSLRQTAIQMLDERNIATNLVCVVKKGVNDLLISEVIRFALRIPCIRGVTFHPIRATGRHSQFSIENSISLQTVRQTLEGELKKELSLELFPHPNNPIHVAIGYLQKTLTGYVDISSQIMANMDKFETQYGVAPMFVQREDAERVLNIQGLFRIHIVEYMDAINFNFEDLSFSNIAMIEQDGSLVPTDFYYLRDQLDCPPLAFSDT